MELPVCEVYPTVQGEGLLVGTPVTLIRFQGCNIYCAWCDTKYAIPFKEEVKIPLEEVLKKVRSFKRDAVLITGGEPLAHPEVVPLIESLLREDYFVQLETNGTLWRKELERFPKDRVYVSLSPKYSVDYRVHPGAVARADELKMVVDENLTLEVLKRPEFLPFARNGRLVLQPEGNRKEMVRKGLKLLDDLLKEGLKARLIPQVHKLVGLP
ncbi:MAG: 7-carboxy-7-deazaguanine synthase QueE [Aquificae bacterium]|nr:7-carboxy-7-deazaguanine synthase QueE [Aquificota bacterium]